MKNPSAKEIRAAFLDFFAEKEHRIVPSAPVVPQGDATLLFTNAGMNQFKDVFLGTGSRDFSRATDTQKCIRVSGKHNDLEEVGVDTYHHTFFEMLGNWSFGDYFKREAIAWAWELLVDRFGLDPDRLYVTVFGGDEDEGLEADTESEALWPEITGIPADRVMRFGRKDNFWEMGDVGPCGPCTEIHYDLGPEADEIPDPSDARSGVNRDNCRVIEIWNLVFIQYNRSQDGRLSPLPKQHVDTGMGFERLVTVLQGKTSNYDTDLFTPIFAAIEKVTGRSYGRTNSAEDIAFRVIADHVRTLSVAFADGVLPKNEGRGYVLRRILRRAARFGRQSLGMKRPFIHELVGSVVEVLGDAFPEIAQRRDHIEHLIESEEKAFAKTLDRGLDLYAQLADRVRASGREAIDGGEAYDLYATYGFPRDLVELMAREDGLGVESAGWDAAQAAHREASKSEGRFELGFDAEALEGLPATEQRYYREGHLGDGDGLSCSAQILKVLQDTHVVLDRSPFYSECGGQVSDCGVIEGEGFRFAVSDVRMAGDVVLHIGDIVEGSAAKLPAEVTARVDGDRRRAIMRNHTGTHLLHWALKKVLGDHATQQGSLVAADKLRFDVAHPKAISPEEIEEIERLVNEKIVANAALVTTLESLDEARARGVTALFGEKYDDDVRVVDIAGFSTELCGGTHCSATGDIGAFVVLSESAVQAGVRRIEAATGTAALSSIQAERRVLREAAGALKSSPEELPNRVAALVKQVKELKKSGGRQAAQDAGALAHQLLEAAEVRGEARLVVTQLDIDGKSVSEVADVLRNNQGPVAGTLIAEAGKKVVLVCFASPELAGKSVHAGELAKLAAGILGGGGGGRPDFAQAGGKDASKIAEALEAVRETLRQAL
jgi:alanyl-tRNA synthetase